jgi:hypothetical protein
MSLLLEVAKVAEDEPLTPTGGWSVGDLANLGMMLSSDEFSFRLDLHNLNCLFDLVENAEDGEVRCTNGDILEVSPRENDVTIRLQDDDTFPNGLLIPLKTLKDMGIDQYEEDAGEVADPTEPVEQPTSEFEDLTTSDTIVAEDYVNLDEGIKRAFRRSGSKIKRGFRVTSGFRKGRVVASAKAAFRPRAKASTRMKLKIAGRKKKIIRIMKGKRTRRKPSSKRLVRMNKTLSKK